ncbi:hypothetical protein CAP36_09700 [Chitinophagaceae bacterium IBVUCB2]|nr:hypothetical protein CAP36_09700 [Chitinophagaceae bacterium IBVUCB2]
MHTAVEHIEQIVSKAGDLAETKMEIWKLKAAGKISETVSSLISLIAIIVLAAASLIILSFGAAFWIGKELDNTSYGFFIVGGFYALIGLLVYFFRKDLIKEPLSNLIADKISK